MTTHELGPQTPIRPILSDAEYKTRIAELNAARKYAVAVMKGVKEDLVALKLTTKAAIVHKGWDIHCFFPRRGHPNSIIHMQLYIISMGIEEPPTIDVSIREMDRKKMRKARELVSMGSEINAVTRNFKVSPNKYKDRVLLSQPAMTSLFEQVLFPVDKRGL